MKVGIQGLEGSFHHQAAKQFFQSDLEIAPFETFDQVFEALEAGIIQRAVVAIENSLYGTINDTYDLLLQYKPWIIGEITLHVRLDLLSVEGATLEGLTDIYSQAPALGEAKKYLREHAPAAKQHEYPDTGMSARLVSKKNNPTAAAIASEMSGQLYNLTPVAEGIQDHKHNYTKFVVLSREQHVITDADKSSIILKASNTSGSLYAALGVFAERDINLTKLESRPYVDDHGWHYMFYIDFEAGINSEAYKQTLEALETNGYEVIVLGSFKHGELPNIDAY